MLPYFEKLVDGMCAGVDWTLMGETDKVKDLLTDVFDERAHKNDRDGFLTRVNLQRKDDAASFAGFIVAEANPTSGPYQGTSFVWFPGVDGSVVVLVIGTDGFGADTAILGRPGHARRLRALARMHRGSLWVKPDLLDLTAAVPGSVTGEWPEIIPQLKSYSRFTYAAAPCRAAEDGSVVADLFDLFLYEHAVRHKGRAKVDWEDSLAEIDANIFPVVTVNSVTDLLQERRFVILEGPPGTGKTMLAGQVGDKVGSSEMIQFHPARTYEDFVVGLYPRAEHEQLVFEVRSGDLLRANDSAKHGPHVPENHSPELTLSQNLFVLGTRNTADRSIARIDLAIRRRFSFVEMWPQLSVVEREGVSLAIASFKDVLRTFVEFADDEGLTLVPGHAYFLDPRPDLDLQGRTRRITRRLEFELIPLLRDYVQERLLGPATSEIAGLADRLEAAIRAEDD